MPRKKVYCLYRVSTKGQVEKDDIPMQRQVCREFAEKQGWEIVRELTEKGVSGFKVSAKDRDAIQEMQQDALLGKFDVLLVFMFDRLGRKEDETPFVVEWFANHGIEVWSTVEGQQKFDDHIDKLLNYIRFWQASGESIKTSIRTKTRLGQIVQEGHFRGGTCPYGYELNKRGRIGKKNRELYEIEICESEAPTVERIFDLCVNRGYGGRRIASALKEEGLLNRNGEQFHYSSVQNILRNIMYTGVLRSGDSHSEIIPELQIISPEVFNRAREIVTQRSLKYTEEKNAPRHTMGKALLSGNIYCGHCGGRMFASTAKKSHHVPTEEIPSVRVPIYKCYNRTQYPELCTGQTTYRSARVDNAVEELITELFSRVQGLKESELLDQQYSAKMKEFSAIIKHNQSELLLKTRELSKLDAGLVEALEGTGPFTPERLSRRMDSLETEITVLKNQIADTEVQMQKSTLLLEKIRDEHRQLISWAEVFKDADREVQKMIASYLINKVVINSGEDITIEWNINEEQYSMGFELV